MYKGFGMCFGSLGFFHGVYLFLGDIIVFIFCIGNVICAKHLSPMVPSTYFCRIAFVVRYFFGLYVLW